MIGHKKPDFSYNVDLGAELTRTKNHQSHRGIPARSDTNLLVACWNLTNFGLQKRADDHFRIMAEIIKPFDVVAVQEVADDLKHFSILMSHLGQDWDAIYTDIAGNQERLGYVFNVKRIDPTGLAAELAMRGYERRKITIQVGDEEPEEMEFGGFSRNPHMVSFRAGQFEFTIVNVHLYWTNFAIRKLEAKALTKWARSRVKKPSPPHDDILLMGDFNMPRVEKGDEIYDTLTQGGLQIPKYNTELVGSNLAGDKHFDELAFFPSRTAEDFSNRMGIFDFDKALFPDLWDYADKEKQKRFFQYVRYYIADHRPLWAEFYRRRTS